MTPEEALKKIHSEATEDLADCDRLMARGGIKKWEAVALRGKIDAMSSAAMQLELRLRDFEAEKNQ